MAITEQDLNNRFTYHPPVGDDAAVYQEIRDGAKQLAFQIVQETPESREQSLAITALEEVVFWANAARARHEASGFNG